MTILRQNARFAIVFVSLLGFSTGTWAQNYSGEFDLDERELEALQEQRALQASPAFIAEKVNREKVNDFFKAVRIDNARGVRDLLEQGFDPNRLEPHSGFPALVLALFLENYEVAQALIDEPKTNVELENKNGENALMMAAIKGQLPLVQDLVIKRKASVAKRGWTALHYAASQGQQEVMRFLIEEGSYVDAPAPNQNTPLMMAAIRGNLESVQVLIEQGADPFAKNDQGLRALDWAQRSQKEALVEYLNRAERDFEYQRASTERAKRAAAQQQAIRERQEREQREREERAQQSNAALVPDTVPSEAANLAQDSTSIFKPTPPLASILPTVQSAETGNVTQDAASPAQPSTNKPSTLRYSLPATSDAFSSERPLRYNPIPPPALIQR